jgi:glycosyltransferase involved in cell wall biosynthesis
MRVMLLGDMPPCRNFTAGLVLEQLLPCFDSHELSAVVVVDPSLNPHPRELIAESRMLRLVKPRESRKDACRWPKALSELSAQRFERGQAKKVREELLPTIVEFGKRFGVERIWLNLQGQTMVRLARPVSDALNVPICAQIWDPFGWWLRANRIDRRTAKELTSEFDRVIQRCDSVAAASWSMADSYKEKYGVRAVPVIPGISDELMKRPRDRESEDGDFVIGMAGQLYALAEWHRLLEALNILDWRVGDRKIRLRIFGKDFNMHTSNRVQCEFMGWRDQAEVVQLLTESHLNYIPYWFDPVFKEEAENSFPSKMSTYCAAAQPILVHAPQYATPVAFLEKHDIGYCVTSPSANDVADTIKNAVLDPDARSRKGRNAATCFSTFLSTSCMRRSFVEFLDLPRQQHPSPDYN